MTSQAPLFQLPLRPASAVEQRTRLGRIARVAGIDIYVHWSFALLVAWLFAVQLAQGKSARTALAAAALLLAVFGCVVLHELGHALVARRFGVRTLDITLYPIGGIARLERMPERPIEELLIALAGPAVNLVIATMLAFGLAASGQGGESFTRGVLAGELLPQLLTANVVLAAFNMLPAFPMDGGRALRAILASRMNYVRATRYAATAGQVLAIAFGALGLFFNWFLLFIALFVFVGAEQEARAVETRSLVAGVPVREAMITHFRVLPAAAPLSLAVQELLASEQQDFPVMDAGLLVGMLSRDRLLKAVATDSTETSIGSVMTRNAAAVEDDVGIEAALQRMSELGSRSLPIVRDGELVGLLTLENLGEWLMLHSAWSSRTPARRS